MADTTLLLNGFSIIGDPQTTNANASGGGEFMIHSGAAVFEFNDIVVFEVTGANPDGSLNADSVIVGITVYDNASDYYLGIPLYEYTAPSGSGADIDDGRQSMGDRYLEFDASSLTSSDPDAPVLANMVVVAGVDILGTLASSNGPIKIDTNEDIDLDGDGIISPNEAGDGNFSSDLNVLVVVCFARGTLIETDCGPLPIEILKPGDLVRTLDHGEQPIRWIGSRRVAGTGKNAPVRIRAGALGNVRDLFVSQNHRMLLSGPMAELLFAQSEVLAAAKHLCNDNTIRIVPRAEVEYFHFLFDDHQIVFAEACPTESLFPGKQSLESVDEDARDEIITLFPELEDPDYAGDMARPALKRHEARTLCRSA